MLRRWSQTDLILLLPLFLACTLCGCSISGSVIDRASYETSLSDMRLLNPSELDIFYGGVHRRIPLKDVSSVEINSSVSAVINNELCYSAEIILKDGTRIHTNEKDLTDNTRLFISVHNSIIARDDRDAFRIGLENVFRINLR